MRLASHILPRSVTLCEEVSSLSPKSCKCCQAGQLLSDSHSCLHAWFGACGTSPAVTSAPLQVKIMDAFEVSCFGVLSLWSLVLQEILWLSCRVRSGYRSLNTFINLSKSTGTLGTSSSALIHLPPPFLIPFLLLGASALGLRLEQRLTKPSLALGWVILMIMKLK